MKTLMTTLLIIKQGDKLLLAKKKKGFGEGKVNGCGGKCEPGESVENAMKREALEELGITPTDAAQYGVIDFIEYVKNEKALVKMHIFLATQFNGTPTESDEMMPHWVDINNIPYDKMFPDDKLWLPILLSEKYFKGTFEFDKDFNMISYNITQ